MWCFGFTYFSGVGRYCGRFFQVLSKETHKKIARAALKDNSRVLRDKPPLYHNIFMSLKNAPCLGIRQKFPNFGVCVCVCVCVFFPFILDIKFVGHTSRDRTHVPTCAGDFCPRQRMVRIEDIA